MGARVQLRPVSVSRNDGGLTQCEDLVGCATDFFEDLVGVFAEEIGHLGNGGFRAGEPDRVSRLSDVSRVGVVPGDERLVVQDLRVDEDVFGFVDGGGGDRRRVQRREDLGGLLAANASTKIVPNASRFSVS